VGEEANVSSEASGRPGDPSRPVTISFIAETAGVSVPTVSKVINGRAGVAAGTRARVESLISAYSYRKSSPPARSTVLELVFDELESMWGVEIIRGVQRTARKHHLGVVLSEFGPDGSTIRYWIDGVLARRPACVVTVAQLSQQDRDQLRAQGVPFVVFDPTHELPDDVPFVGATNWSGGRAATRHLVQLGHQGIAMITGPDEILCCRARFDGYRSAMEAAGLPILVARADLTPEGGHAAARWPGPTGRPRSSPPTTCRPSACTRRPARQACASRPTSAWSASTTCPSPP
jgi:DNA-binding LacI/PurR family transcriptional regulator